MSDLTEPQPEWRDRNERRRTVIRAWEPGDGLECSYANRSARHFPCGPPVGLVTVHTREVVGAAVSGWWRYKATSRAVCAHHLPGVASPGELRQAAEKAALERLATNHWDEYRDCLDKEVRDRRAAAIDVADEKLRALLLAETTDELEDQQ